MKRLGLLALVLGTLSCTAPTENYSKLASQDFLKAYHAEKGILIDVRTPGEFSGGSIEDAINIDFYAADFEQKIAALDTTKTAFIFCQSGGRSGRSASKFFKVGFDKVVDLKGGYGAYRSGH